MNIFNIAKSAPKERASTQWILDRIEGKAILDIGGVGTNGKVQALTHKILKQGCSVVEVDVAKSSFQHPNLHITTRDALEAVLPDSMFDSAIAVHVVQHVGRNWRGMNTVHDTEGDCKLADKIYQWLKPNGVLFIEVPMACQVQEIVWSDGTSWKVYTMAEILRVFSRFCFENCLIYDGAMDSASRIPGAKAAVVMLRKVA